MKRTESGNVNYFKATFIIIILYHYSIVQFLESRIFVPIKLLSTATYICHSLKEIGDVAVAARHPSAMYPFLINSLKLNRRNYIKEIMFILFYNDYKNNYSCQKYLSYI